MSQPDFDTVDQALRAAGAPGEAAELHGQLCGLSCQLGAAAIQPWMTESLQDSTGPAAGRDAAARLLAELGEQTLASLDQADMSLTLLLPGDEATLEARAEALGFWCQGFMHGLSAAVDRQTLTGSELTGEILRDFSEITKAAFMADETAAEAEPAYAELVEFVRVSTQLVFEECRPLRGDKGEGTTPSLQ